MLSKGEEYYSYWVVTLKICNIFFCFPYKWDAVKERLILLDKKWSQLVYKFTLFTPIVYLVVMCLQMYWNIGTMTLPNILKGLVGMICYGIGSTVRLTYWIWETEGLDMINGILEYEKRLIKAFPNANRKGPFWPKMVFIVGTATTSMFGLCIFLLLMVDPCTPPYIGSMTQQCKTGKPLESWAIKLPIAGFDAMNWYFLGPPSAITLGNMFLGLWQTLLKYIQILSRRFVIGKFTSAATMNVYHHYRQLQLIEIKINVTMRDLFIPGTLLFTSWGVIFSLYTCIKLHGVIPMPGFAFFPMLLTDAVLVIAVGFASAGFVYLKSRNLVQQFKKNYFNGVHKTLKIQANSYQPLKIRFGMNFVDELTSLTVLDFCLNQTVSLILMT